MGAKLFTSYEMSCAHDGLLTPNKYINLQNWRGLRETNYRDTDGLYVILKNFRMYFIPNFTIKEFHEANYCNKTLNNEYKYIKNVLSCDQCNGDGKMDWVETARGGKIKPQHHHGGDDRFIRGKHTPIHKLVYDPKLAPQYVSSVAIKKGEEVCRKCSGSGLLLAAAKQHITESKPLTYS